MAIFQHLSLNNTLALQIFQIMRLGAAVLTGVVLAKSGLSTAEIGAWEMLLYLGTTLTFFWVNGLLQGIAPTFARLPNHQRKRFLFSHYLLFCGIATAVFILLMLGEKWIVPALTGLPEVPYYWLFALYLLLNLPAFPVEYLYLLHHRPARIIWWGVFIFGAHVLLLSIPLYAGYGLGYGIAALVALAGVKFLWATFLAFRLGEPALDTKGLTAYLIFCAPLMLGNVISNLLLLFDNWLVGWHFGDPSVFALYRYGAREFPLALALTSALGAALVPLLATDMPRGLAELKTRSLRLMHALFPLTILLFFVSKPLFPLVFNPEFVYSANLFNIYLLTLASRVLLPASIVLGRSDSRQILWAGVAELMVKIVLGALFIQWWGLEGLAWSVVLSFWVEKIWLIGVLEKKHGIRTAEWLPWRWYVFYTVVLFVVYFSIH